MVIFFGTETSPSSADFLADDHPEERRLPGAVRADETGVLAGLS
jgi:hypothetical protein